MSEDHLSMIEAEADASSTANHDVLQILRDFNGPSLAGYGNLDEAVEFMLEELSASIKSFTGENLELEVSEISIFSGEKHTIFADKAPMFARIDANDEYLLACLGLSRSTFRRILNIAFTGFENAGSEYDDKEFTLAEDKLFLRFLDQFMAWYFEIADSIADAGIPRNPYHIDDEILFETTTDRLIVSVLIDVVKKDFKDPIQVLVPMEILVPDNDEEEIDAEAEKAVSEEAQIWGRKLAELVETVGIPLHAELASSQIPLSQISALLPGQRLDIELDLNGLKILDENGLHAFTANVEIAPDNSTQLRVTGTNRNNRS